MPTKIQAIKGMNDILPTESHRWQWVEALLRRLMARYGYQEIRLPILEFSQLFTASIGEVTDIVEKEMYAFTDQGGDELSLRPEGTAGCVRAGIEHGLFYNQIQRLWYSGPMFRRENPQKGRYRQFHQFGVEAVGLTGPDIDAELIFMLARLWRECGVAKRMQLQINSLGQTTARAEHREALIEYFEAHRDQLDEDAIRRLHTNPLRILDTKNPAMQDLVAGAPQLADFWDETTKNHFQKLCQRLEVAGIIYTVNPRLVRGLDYYSGTVFEWVSDDLGAQGTVCGGGRYDPLIERRGGRATPAIGFSIGLERLLLLLGDTCQAYVPDVYLVLVGEDAQLHGMVLAEQWRDACPNLAIVCNCDGGSFKSQFKRADKSGAQIALVIGESEVEQSQVVVKYLRSDQAQQTMPQADVVTFLESIEGTHAC